MTEDWSTAVSGPRGKYDELSLVGKLIYLLHAFWCRYQVASGTIPGILNPIERVLTHLFLAAVYIVTSLALWNVVGRATRSALSGL
eukprot:tig00020943_g16248.t1